MFARCDNLTMNGETERDFQNWVVDAAKLFGWRVAHFRPAYTGKGWRTPMQGNPGFPDLVLVKPPRLIFAELKVNPETQRAGRPSLDQEGWLSDLRQVVGAECHLWRPADRPEILKALGLAFGVSKTA